MMHVSCRRPGESSAMVGDVSATIRFSREEESSLSRRLYNVISAAYKHSQVNNWTHDT